MFAQPSASALNHLLQQNRWAMQRLVRFAGKTARFNIAPFSFVWTIQADGSLENAEDAASADVVCDIPLSLLPRLAMQDEQAHAEIRSEGDAALLTEIFFLSRNLRWDAAEDLSRVTGDVAAERIVQAAQDAKQHLLDAATSLSQAAAEYWTEERPLLVKPGQIATFVQQVDALRDDLARLEQRVKRLQSSGNP